MAKEKDAEPTLESLEPIRQSIRRLCIQDQFTWEQSWKSVLSDVNQVRRGLLLPDVFQQTLELNEIRLTRKALEAVIEQFQLPNGAVQAHKFLQWIDLSKPSDHIDPDLTFARLPQPYRRIVKVLESDILDAAWAEIQATSAKYKAETSAALSARSARSSVLLTHAPEDASALQDDYAAAKKRCCKPMRELLPPGNAESVAAVKVHSSRPFAVLCWCGADGSDTGLTLELIKTELSASISSIQIDIPAGTAPGVAAGEPVSRSLVVVSTSELRSRPRAETTVTPEETRLVVAIHVRETVPTADTTVSVDHLLIYEFIVSTTVDISTASCLSSLVFSDPSEAIVGLTLSHDVSLLAVGTTKCEVSVYSVPVPPAQSETAEAETTPAPPATLPALVIVTKLPTDAPPIALHFLYPPIVDSPTRPSPSSVALRPYAMATVAAKTLVKYRLPPPNSDTSVAPTIMAKWPHLTKITSCSVDSTSQFITVGLVDGLVVVWDLLADRDHVMLTPPAPSTATPSTGNAVDVAFFCGEQFVVVLSLASQRLFFYDIANRASPSLLRVVTPPPPPSTATAAAVEPIRFISVSPHTPLLDVPVAAVTYSNGYVMIYDVRNGEAMASFRVSKEALAEPSHGAGPVDVALASSAIVALSPSPVVFDWRGLLTTAFPSLVTVLQSKRLEPSAENFKREFIASVDLSAGGIFSDGATLSIGAKPSLHSMLLASAGHGATTVKPTMALFLSGSSSSSSLSQATSNSDSRTSLATTASDMAATPPLQESRPLPSLLESAPVPYKPTIGALFERFCAEEINAATAASAEAKLHRRRNELIKILTAAW